MDYIVAFVTCALVALAALGAPIAIDSTQCVVKAAGAVWYRGPAYALECKSQGSSTQCSAHKKGMAYMIPTKHIISDKLEVTCE